MRPGNIQTLRRNLACGTKVIKGPTSNGHSRRCVQIKKRIVVSVGDNAHRRNLPLGPKVKCQAAIARIEVLWGVKE